MKKFFVLGVLAALLGTVLAHSPSEEYGEYGELGWHYGHMLEHHGSLSQWAEDHDDLDWYDHHRIYGMTGGGCH